MITREVNTRESGFAYFIEEKFSHLNIAALFKRVAENSLSCAFSCLKHLACFSFNFAAFPDKTGKFTCEILSSDNYNNSKSFLPSKTFHHFSILVSNLSLNFALTFGQPEWLIKRQNSRYPIRNWTFIAKEARNSILHFCCFWKLNTICYEKGIESTRPWIKLMIQASLKFSNQEMAYCCVSNLFSRL